MTLSKTRRTHSAHRPRASSRPRPWPACVARSSRTRFAAPSCSPRVVCARSPAGSMRRCTLRSGMTPPGMSRTRCTNALTRSSKAAIWWTGRAVGSAVLLLTARPPDRLSAQATIDTIVVVNHNIFDLSDDAPGFLARLANGLHVTTRAGVIRRTLLVNPGDRYDSARVAESERALRGLYVFSRVRLDSTSVAGRLALRIETSDGWSTKPQFGYSSAGGDVTWLAGLVEENLLGTAAALAAVYNKTPDRSVVDLRYGSPHFFGRRTRVVAEYASKSDGKRGLWFLGVPFYETGARRALGTDGEAAAERVLVFHHRVPAATVDTVERRALQVGVSAGLALQATSRGFVRLWASGEWRREDFGPESTFVFPRSTFGAVGAGVDVGHVRFNVLERFNSYARREDVDLSQLLHLGLWAAPRAWGYPSGRAGIGPEASAQVSAPCRGGFAVLQAAANGVFTTGRPDSARVTGSFTVASQNLRRQTLILHLEGGALRRPKPGAEFDLWVLEKGPRVFGIHQFTGTRMLWLALEDRILVRDELWGLVGLGIAPFFDYGGAWWYGDEPTRLGGDVGLALRMGPTRAVHGDVGEIALGYRFGRGFGGWAVAVRKGVAF